MTTLPGGVTSHWLRLREPVDALARSRRLVDSVCADLVEDVALEIHDLGCGDGSMGRWLAPQLHRPQQWVLHDQDAGLLEIAADTPPRAPDGFRVTVETSLGDLAALEPVDFQNASLITASAVLDILTAGELTDLVDLCTTVGCPALFALSVTGNVRFSPSDPLDAAFGAAFNDHQRRTTGGRPLLGPDAPRRTVDLFVARGAEVEVAESDWRLGAGSPRLAEEWLLGWVDAACEQQPDLARARDGFLEQRRGQLAQGSLEVTVAHVDVLARPRRHG